MAHIKESQGPWLKDPKEHPLSQWPTLLSSDSSSSVHWSLSNRCVIETGSWKILSKNCETFQTAGCVISPIPTFNYAQCKYPYIAFPFSLLFSSEIKAPMILEEENLWRVKKILNFRQQGQGSTSPLLWKAHTPQVNLCPGWRGRKGDTRIGDQAQPLLPHRQSSPQQGDQDGQRTSCHHHRSSRWSRSSPPPLSGAGTHQRTQQTYGSMNWKLSTPKTWLHLLGFLTLVTVFQGFEAGLWQYLKNTF